MGELRIIFWVCVVESFIGHVSWYVPCIAFLISAIVGLLIDNEEAKQKAEMKKILEDMTKGYKKK